MLPPNMGQTFKLLSPCVNDMSVANIQMDGDESERAFQEIGSVSMFFFANGSSLFNNTRRYTS